VSKEATVSDGFEERAAERRATMQVHVAHSRAEVEALERARERALPPHARAEAIWPLVRELWIMRGGDAAELRFDRSVARLERRRR
jgi:hypothetical protein